MFQLFRGESEWGVLPCGRRQWLLPRHHLGAVAGGQQPQGRQDDGPQQGVHRHIGRTKLGGGISKHTFIETHAQMQLYNNHLMQEADYIPHNTSFIKCESKFQSYSTFTMKNLSRYF